MATHSHNKSSYVNTSKSFHDNVIVNDGYIHEYNENTVSATENRANVSTGEVIAVDDVTINEYMEHNTIGHQNNLETHLPAPELVHKQPGKAMVFSIPKSSMKSSSAIACSTNPSKSVVLFNISYPTSNQYIFYSSIYTARFENEVITFSFGTLQSWLLDDISIIDELTKFELIQNGGFENGTLNGYCLSDPLNNSFAVSFVDAYQGSCACYIIYPFTPVELTQTVNTTIGRVYNVSFWLLGQIDAPSPVDVYMGVAVASSGNYCSMQFIVLVFIFFTIYGIF
ncbi:unnamed protein product [Adineta steineri]|uniref:Uncharacterized protein n=1 Tax=Adineta steineri TaxID=433720 RepID=A0A819N030_9BILA|nr:unnamed protein product [Adineta steineri]